MIILTPGVTYEVETEMEVTRSVTIIGQPLDRPIIDGHTIQRVFFIQSGGFLDVRFVHIRRGRAVEVIPEFLYELRGSAVYVREGGQGGWVGTISRQTRPAPMRAWATDGGERRSLSASRVGAVVFTDILFMPWTEPDPDVGIGRMPNRQVQVGRQPVSGSLTTPPGASS